MSVEVSEASLTKLEAAARALLEGRPALTDGRLTKRNLHVEAGVSHSTMNRASEFLRDWEREVAATRAQDGRRNEPAGESAQRSSPTQLREIARVRDELQAARLLIAALHADNQRLRERLLARSRNNLTALPVRAVELVEDVRIPERPEC